MWMMVRRRNNRQRDSQTDRQSDSQTDRQRQVDRQVYRQTDRRTDRDRWNNGQVYRQTDRRTDRDRWTDRCTGRQTGGQTDRQVDRQVDRQTDRWTDGQTGGTMDRCTDRQTDRQVEVLKHMNSSSDEGESSPGPPAFVPLLQICFLEGSRTGSEVLHVEDVASVLKVRAVSADASECCLQDRAIIRPLYCRRRDGRRVLTETRCCGEAVCTAGVVQDGNPSRV
ncbi:hypothetical protein FQA47_015219 [Oryzias melastigma]|uniref:Uncharacterized protein n=1 Tax=Oryzias melastigma TaxID=30732 RepID=A0A834F9K7_ORYME|nr:hypothetical protein FQA47_015219 [Oryzias melastigma]